MLFLDEPTTGLDLTSRNALWETIEQLVADGTTVMLTTQYLEEADRLAERIAVVDGGLVIANDTPTNLKSQLGSTVVEMRFEKHDGSERAATLLTGNVNGQVERDDGTLRITSNDGARILIDVLRALDANDIVPQQETDRDQVEKDAEGARNAVVRSSRSRFTLRIGTSMMEAPCQEAKAGMKRCNSP